MWTSTCSREEGVACRRFVHFSLYILRFDFLLVSLGFLTPQDSLPAHPCIPTPFPSHLVRVCPSSRLVSPTPSLVSSRMFSRLTTIPYLLKPVLLFSSPERLAPLSSREKGEEGRCSLPSAPRSLPGPPQPLTSPSSTSSSYTQLSPSHSPPLPRGLCILTPLNLKISSSLYASSSSVQIKKEPPDSHQVRPLRLLPRVSARSEQNEWRPDCMYAATTLVLTLSLSLPLLSSPSSRPPRHLPASSPPSLASSVDALRPSTQYIGLYSSNQVLIG